MNQPATAACDRCGTFSDERRALGSRSLCPACLAHVATGARYWSSRYVSGLGVLLNPTPAAVLLALNWQRAGDPKRARQMWLNAGILGVCYLALLFSGVELPGAVTIGVGIGLGVWLGRTFQEPSERLRAAGAQSANRFLPVLCTLIAFAVVIAVMVFTMPDEGIFEP
ncbi:MAG: hypothetical protein AB1730_17425 [Myxococcota bacterium]|jgi:hypothetical protein